MNELPAERPKIRLDFYEAAIFLTRFDQGQTTTYPVSVHDVAHACAGIPLASGLLPPNTLFWERQGNSTTLALFVPARRWQMQLAEGINYHLPMPPFIFAGSGTAYYAYAVKRRPRQLPIPLWRMPCPNVHSNGHICPGDAPFPDTFSIPFRNSERASRYSSRLSSKMLLWSPSGSKRKMARLA